MKPEFTDEHYEIIEQAIYNDWVVQGRGPWAMSKEPLSVHIIKHIKSLAVPSKLERLEERLEKMGYETGPILSAVKELYGDK